MVKDSVASIVTLVMLCWPVDACSDTIIVVGQLLALYAAVLNYKIMNFLMFASVTGWTTLEPIL